ncbi:hypothetical protein BZY71_20625 [Leclercia adecarboxylata]|uniref:ESPR domain-containing protein n=1 Tax=Leclercia adecarboxylata TaxID=83655 RepID=UPI000980BACE|nr:hypothetical protein BZY71_20625 [Leclercia adecarboxylata]
MNKIFRHVWSQSAGCLIAVSELTTSNAGKRSARRRLLPVSGAVLVLSSFSGGAMADDVTWVPPMYSSTLA